MTEQDNFEIKFLESMRGNFFGDLLLEILKLLNIYHKETSYLDRGNGIDIQIVDPNADPDKYNQLNRY